MLIINKSKGKLIKMRRNKWGEIVPMNCFGINDTRNGVNKMKEAEFNSEVVRSLKHLGYFAYKISDVMGSRFTPEKPCDILACDLKGRFIAIESKQIKSWKSLTGKMLRDNQIVTLDKSVKITGRAYVLLNIRIHDVKNKRRENWCVVFDWSIHRESIMNNKYTAKVLQDGYVGEWLLPSKDDEGKIIWPLKNL